MRAQSQTRPKRLADYPDQTRGSRLAAQARTLASAHSPEERQAHLQAARKLISGRAAASRQTALPRH